MRSMTSAAFGSSGVIAGMPCSAASAATLSNQIVSAGIVVVRDDQRDVDAVRQQHLQTADADVVIGEYDRASVGERCGSVRVAVPGLACRLR